MPYCPQCLQEYVDGTAECEDCHVTLAPGSPPAPLTDEEADSADGNGRAIARAARSLFSAGDSTRDPDVPLASIKTFTGRTALMDADLARNILRAEGITCVLQGETSAAILPVLAVPLLVPEPDASRAKAILRDYFDPPG